MKCEVRILLWIFTSFWLGRESDRRQDNRSCMYKLILRFSRISFPLGNLVEVRLAQVDWVEKIESKRLLTGSDSLCFHCHSSKTSIHPYKILWEDKKKWKKESKKSNVYLDELWLINHAVVEWRRCGWFWRRNYQEDIDRRIINLILFTPSSPHSCSNLNFWILLDRTPRAGAVLVGSIGSGGRCRRGLKEDGWKKILNIKNIEFGANDVVIISRILQECGPVGFLISWAWDSHHNSTCFYFVWWEPASFSVRPPDADNVPRLTSEAPLRSAWTSIHGCREPITNPVMFVSG